MAIDAGELVVKISADIADMKAAMQIATQSVGQLQGSTGAMGVAMGISFAEITSKIISFGKESVQAFEDSQLAMTRLSFFVGNDAANAFKKFADQMEENTTFSHTDVLALESQLSAFGVLPGSIEPATEALINYAAATGKTLPEAGAQLSRAIQGQSRDLKQYGLILNASDDQTTHMNQTIAFLDQRFSGMAGTIRDTVAGQMDVLKNKMDSLKEAAGKDIVDAIGFWGGALKTVAGALGISADKVKYLSDVMSGNVTVTTATIQKLKEERTAIEEQARGRAAAHDGVVRLSEEEQKRIVVITKEIAALKTQATQEKTTSIAGVQGVQVVQTKAEQAVEERIAGMTLEMQTNDEVQNNIQQITLLTTDIKIQKSIQELDQLAADQAQITEITDIETAKRLATSKNSWEANANFSDQFKVKLQNDMNQNTATFASMGTSMMSMFSQATAKMIVEGGRFKDVMQNLWKQMAEQFIAEVIRMIAEWLVLQAMTGGAGFGLGGFMAEGGMINEPSIITGMKTGTRHIAGEAGPEMVMPASKIGGSGNYAFSSTPSAGGGSGSGGGGGDIHINISGQFLEGSSAKWQQMLREQIAPEIRRWTMSSPVGSFNRKRGAT